MIMSYLNQVNVLVYYHYYLYIGEINRIRTVPEYEHSRYLRNHKSYKKMFNEYKFIII